MSVRVLHGDMRELLPTLSGLDACVCDPPYHLTSIVQRFGGENAAPAQFGTDGAFARASRGFMGKQWDGGDIALRPDTWRLVYDALKPGAYILAFSSCRTYHHMATAIEAAGFITHPFLAWIFGTGFPKATRLNVPGTEGFRYGGQALKPAIEPIYMGQKPMEGTGTQNWLKHGTGAINVDACRVPAPDGLTSGGAPSARNNPCFMSKSVDPRTERTEQHPAGRWPANVLHDGSDEVEAAFAAFGADHRSKFTPASGRRNRQQAFGMTEGVGYSDTGTASRFYYSAKASKADRAGSKHPTVKPLALMRWLVRLVTPPGGRVLDCFAGSGTTGEAAMLEGFNAVLIERENEYIADINRRIERATQERTTIVTTAQLDMFG